MNDSNNLIQTGHLNIKPTMQREVQYPSSANNGCQTLNEQQTKNVNYTETDSDIDRHDSECELSIIKNQNRSTNNNISYSAGVTVCDNQNISVDNINLSTHMANLSDDISHHETKTCNENDFTSLDRHYSSIAAIQEHIVNDVYTSYNHEEYQVNHETFAHQSQFLENRDENFKHKNSIFFQRHIYLRDKATQNYLPVGRVAAPLNDDTIEIETQIMEVEVNESDSDNSDPEDPPVESQSNNNENTAEELVTQSTSDNHVPLTQSSDKADDTPSTSKLSPSKVKERNNETEAEHKTKEGERKNVADDIKTCDKCETPSNILEQSDNDHFKNELNVNNQGAKSMEKNESLEQQKCDKADNDEINDDTIEETEVKINTTKYTKKNEEDAKCSEDGSMKPCSEDETEQEQNVEPSSNTFANIENDNLSDTGNTDWNTSERYNCSGVETESDIKMDEMPKDTVVTDDDNQSDLEERKEHSKREVLVNKDIEIISDEPNEKSKDSFTEINASRNKIQNVEGIINGDEKIKKTNEGDIADADMTVTAEKIISKEDKNIEKSDDVSTTVAESLQIVENKGGGDEDIRSNDFEQNYLSVNVTEEIKVPQDGVDEELTSIIADTKIHTTKSDVAELDADIDEKIYVETEICDILTAKNLDQVIETHDTHNEIGDMKQECGSLKSQKSEDENDKEEPHLNEGVKVTNKIEEEIENKDVGCDKTSEQDTDSSNAVTQEADDTHKPTKLSDEHVLNDEAKTEHIADNQSDDKTEKELAIEDETKEKDSTENENDEEVVVEDDNLKQTAMDDEGETIVTRKDEKEEGSESSVESLQIVTAPNSSVADTAVEEDAEIGSSRRESVEVINIDHEVDIKQNETKQDITSGDEFQQEIEVDVNSGQSINIDDKPQQDVEVECKPEQNIEVDYISRECINETQRTEQGAESIERTEPSKEAENELETVKCYIKIEENLKEDELPKNGDEKDLEKDVEENNLEKVLEEKDREKVLEENDLKKEVKENDLEKDVEGDDLEKDVEGDDLEKVGERNDLEKNEEENDLADVEVRDLEKVGDRNNLADVEENDLADIEENDLSDVDKKDLADVEDNARAKDAEGYQLAKYFEHDELEKGAKVNHERDIKADNGSDPDMNVNDELELDIRDSDEFERDFENSNKTGLCIETEDEVEQQVGDKDEHKRCAEAQEEPESCVEAMNEQEQCIEEENETKVVVQVEMRTEQTVEVKVKSKQSVERQDKNEQSYEIEDDSMQEIKINDKLEQIDETEIDLEQGKNEEESLVRGDEEEIKLGKEIECEETTQIPSEDEEAIKLKEATMKETNTEDKEQQIEVLDYNLPDEITEDACDVVSPSDVIRITTNKVVSALKSDRGAKADEVETAVESVRPEEITDDSEEVIEDIVEAKTLSDAESSLKIADDTDHSEKMEHVIRMGSKNSEDGQPDNVNVNNESSPIDKTETLQTESQDILQCEDGTVKSTVKPELEAEKNAIEPGSACGSAATELKATEDLKPVGATPRRKKKRKAGSRTRSLSKKDGSTSVGGKSQANKKSPSPAAGGAVSKKSPGAKNGTQMTTSRASSAESKKIPPIKAPVGYAAPPKVKNVKSKIGSLDNIKHKPKGGDKKVESQKLEWNIQSKVGSLDNATHKPGGGDKKIATQKLDFKVRSHSKVGSKDNIKHKPGGGIIKVETQKLDFKDKATSKVGSLDNVKHKPGGGNVCIEKMPFKERSASKLDSLSGSERGSECQSPVAPSSPTPDMVPLATENSPEDAGSNNVPHKETETNEQAPQDDPTAGNEPAETNPEYT